MGSLACRECGSDQLTGWSEAAEYDDLDLPEPSVPDTLEEFLGETSAPRFSKPAFIVVLVAAAFLYMTAVR